MADVMAEAMGYWAGLIPGRRYLFALHFDALEAKDHVLHAESHADMTRVFKEFVLDDDIYREPDFSKLLYLLLKLPDQIKLIVGHSKGGLSIASSLESLLRARKLEWDQSKLSQLAVVTLGAVAYFPESFTEVHQYIGTLDGLGWLNSVYGPDRTDVLWAGHSMNVHIPPEAMSVFWPGIPWKSGCFLA